VSDPLQIFIQNKAAELRAARTRIIDQGAKFAESTLNVPYSEAHRQLDEVLPKISGLEVPDLPKLPDLERPPVRKAVPMGERILGSAAAHRGLAYQWGGTGNPSFDCSGLTQRAHADNGITIGRTTYDQIKNGREIPWGQQQIGDLIFSRFSAPGVPEHVSIWAGNGKVFEAGNPLDYYAWGDRGTVRVRRMW